MMTKATAATLIKNHNSGGRNGPPPAPQEEDRHQGPQGHHGDVLAQKIEAEAHTAVFHMIAGDQLMLRFRDIKGDALHFGHGTHEKDDEGQRLQQDKGAAGLGVDDVYQAERSGPA